MSTTALEIAANQTLTIENISVHEFFSKITINIGNVIDNHIKNINNSIERVESVINASSASGVLVDTSQLADLNDKLERLTDVKSECKSVTVYIIREDMIPFERFDSRERYDIKRDTAGVDFIKAYLSKTEPSLNDAVTKMMSATASSIMNHEQDLVKSIIRQMNDDIKALRNICINDDNISRLQNELRQLLTKYES